LRVYFHAGIFAQADQPRGQKDICLYSEFKPIKVWKRIEKFLFKDLSNDFEWKSTKKTFAYFVNSNRLMSENGFRNFYSKIYQSSLGKN